MRSFVTFLIIALYFANFSIAISDDKKGEEKKLSENKHETEKIKDQVDWVKCEECFVEIQKPKGWFFSKKVIPNGFEYNLTPDEMSNTSVFKRGLSFTVLSNLKKSTNISPSQQIEKFISNAKNIDPKLEIKKTDMQELQGSSFLIKDPANTPESLISSIFLVANDKTDTMYTFVFQYEKKETEKMSAIGSQVLKNLKISKEY